MPGSEFGKYQSAVGDYIKHAPLAGNKLRIQAELLLKFLRHTGGPGFIVSLSAIMNLNLHNLPLQYLLI